MPFRPEHSLLKIDVANMHTIDTRSVENLFGMWSVFSRTSEAMEDGKRLENLSWRLWNRETFCCCPETQARSSSRESSFPLRTTSDSIPDLASSVSTQSSLASDEASTTPPQSPTVCSERPALRRLDSGDSRSRGRERHISSIDLEKIVISIKQKKVLAPLAPLPHSGASVLPTIVEQSCSSTPRDEVATPTQPQISALSALATQHQNPLSSNPVERSASAVDTAVSSEPGTSRRTASIDSSTSNEMNTHSVVRGFVPGGAPSSYRSQTQLAQPTPILKTSSQYHQRGKSEHARRKGAMFTLGDSSSPDESSLDSNMLKNSVSSLSQGLSKQMGKKHAAFKDDLEVSKAVQDSPVFESDDDDDDDLSDAIEDDEEDSSEWEDEVGDSGRSSVVDDSLFARVDSRPNLTSRRSMLTSLMHEPDRAKALANAASRSTPALRRSRTTSPNGPSQESSPMKALQSQAAAPERPADQTLSHATPIIMTTSNTHQPSLSPRTTRRNMLSTELTESLRKNLLWERQHKSSQNLAAMKRRHTSHDVKNLKQYPDAQPMILSKENGKNFSNDYFSAGLQEYHAKGW